MKQPNIRSVLITGGGSGIGAALALATAARGVRVLIAGRRSKPLQEVAESSDRIAPIAVDVTTSASRATLANAFNALPGPRALVHAAGSFQVGTLDSLSEEDWRRSIATNVEARWALTRDCAGPLERGRVLFVSSDSADRPRRGATAYSIAQAASQALRGAFQEERADRNIAIGSFKPGLVDTAMVRGFMQRNEDEFPARSVFADVIDSGSIAQPATVARFARWLLLDVGDPMFADTEWDIRDSSHHHAWLDGPLYPHSP